MTLKLLIASTIIATISIAAGYIYQEFFLGLLFILFTDMLCLIGQWRKWSWVGSFTLLLFAALAVKGVLIGTSAELMLFAFISAFISWDLDRLQKRIKRTRAKNEMEILERQHCSRLLVVCGSSFLLGIIALRIKMELSFGLVLLLGIVLVIGISQAIRIMIRESD